MRKLLIETSSKSIIVKEDIDCSLKLTGRRKGKKEADEKEAKDLIQDKKNDEKKRIRVTLSGY